MNSCRTEARDVAPGEVRVAVGVNRQVRESQRYPRRSRPIRGALASLLAAGLLTGGLATTQAAGTWSIVPSPAASVYGGGLLSGVSCVSGTFSCTAVGTNNTTFPWSTLVESWNGGGWSIVPSPSLSSYIGYGSSLSGVSCVWAGFCMAVGNHVVRLDPSAPGDAQTLFESWNGSAWSIVSSPNAGSLDDVLSSVSCRSTRSCMAVGYYNTQTCYSGYVYNCAPRTLAELWNGGAWSIIPIQNQGMSDNVLTSVSCVSDGSCVAVGYYNGSTAGAVSGGNVQPLTESWNGQYWSIMPRANLQSKLYGGSLSGVSCLSAISCIAVGHYTNGIDRTLVEYWNGTKWSLMQSPNAGGGTYVNTICVGALNTGICVPPPVQCLNGTCYPDQLSSVSCVLTQSCTAVGYWRNGTTDQTLVESLNGTTWSIVPSPNIGTTYNNYLPSVSCVSTNFCTAVGYWQHYGLNGGPLIEQGP